MHRRIRNHDERSGNDREASDIAPQSKGVEAERAKYRGAGNFDVESVFAVDKS